jgi:SAM-dependent methyltransferase
MMEIDEEVITIMKLESLFYSLFGNNLVIGAHIRKQLSFLSEILPPELLYRNMDDLGCGDGKVTLLLEEILQPAKLRGFDVNPGLVGRAVSRGIDARVMDLDSRMPGGELAVVWGVLHHLRDFDTSLCRLKDSYPLVFIREPVRTSFITGLELGHPLKLKELTSLFGDCFPDCRLHYCDNSVLMFYTCPEYQKNLEKTSIPLASLSYPEPSIAGKY